IIRNNNFNPAFFLVDQNAANRCWLKRVHNKGRDVVGPWNDIDFLALHFLHDSLNATTRHTDTGANRINRAVMADDANFGSATRITRCRFDFDDAIVDFGNFLCEQQFHEIGMRARQKYLWTTVFAANIQNQRTNAVADTSGFTRDLLVTANNTFGTAKINYDMAKLNRLHHTGDDFTRTVLEFFILTFTLCVADFLEYDLFRRLRVNAAKIYCGQRINNKVSDFRSRLQLFSLFQVNLLEIVFDFFNHFNHTPQPQITALQVELCTNVIFRAIARSRGFLNRFFHRFDHNGLVDHLFGCNRTGYRKQFSFIRRNGTGHD